MRPSGRTAVASVRTSPAPPTARPPRWTRCQSLAKPSTLEYSHIGETNTRLPNFTSRIASGSNRPAICISSCNSSLTRTQRFHRGFVDLRLITINGSGSEVFAKHRHAVLRFGFRRFVLQNVPVFSEAAVLDPDNIRCDPG